MLWMLTVYLVSYSCLFHARILWHIRTHVDIHRCCLPWIIMIYSRLDVCVTALKHRQMCGNTCMSCNVVVLLRVKFFSRSNAQTQLCAFGLIVLWINSCRHLNKYEFFWDFFGPFGGFRCNLLLIRMEMRKIRKRPAKLMKIQSDKMRKLVKNSWKLRIFEEIHKNKQIQANTSKFTKTRKFTKIAANSPHTKNLRKIRKIFKVFEINANNHILFWKESTFPFALPTIFCHNKCFNNQFV